MSDLLAALSGEVSRCVAPLAGDEPCGGNPRDLPGYRTLREEMAKLSSLNSDEPIDWSEVTKLGLSLLQNDAKDLLVAAYVAHGWCRLHGVVGCFQGVELLASLLENFGEHLWPPARKRRTRIQAVEFFIEHGAPQLKLGDSLKKGLGSLDASDVLENFNASLKRLQEATDEVLGAQAVSLRPLTQAAAKLQLPARPKETPVQKSEAPKPVDREPREVTLRRTASELLSASNACESLDARSIRLWMIGLYLGLEAPPHTSDGNRTLLNAPPQNLWDEFTRLVDSASWRELCTQSIKALETHPLALDLHYFLAQGLGQLGGAFQDAAAIHRHELQGLLTRAAGLSDLAFKDGTPLANATTQAFLKFSVGDAQVADQGSKAVDGSEDSEAQTRQEAQKLVAEGRGEEAIEQLWRHAREAPSEQVRFVRKLFIAELCAKLQQNAAAEALFSELVGVIEERGLGEWDPSLATNTYRAYRDCAHALERRGGSSSRSSEWLERQWFRLDPAASQRTSTKRKR